jgi:hypothetical protein
VTSKGKIVKIDEFLKELERILSLGYVDGKDSYFSLITEIQDFLRSSFEDGEMRVKECIPLYLRGDLAKKVELFPDCVRQIKNHLDAYKEALEFQDMTFFNDIYDNTCFRCGKEIDKDSNFCKYCGQKTMVK